METQKHDPIEAESSGVTYRQFVTAVHNMGETPTRPKHDWVWLNVCSTIFSTTRFTLTQNPDSFFCHLNNETSGVHYQKDDTGAYLVDRNPNYFNPILDYWRHVKLLMDRHPILWDGVLEEAKFFNIKPLTALAEEQIRNRDFNNLSGEKPEAQRNVRQHPVYRILRKSQSCFLSQHNSKRPARVRFFVMKYYHTYTYRDSNTGLIWNVWK